MSQPRLCHRRSGLTVALACGALALAAGGTYPMAAGAATSAPQGDMVTICHATGSSFNPYSVMTLGTAELTGHAGHAGDITPAPSDGCPTSAEMQGDTGVPAGAADTAVAGASAAPGRARRDASSEADIAAAAAEAAEREAAAERDATADRAAAEREREALGDAEVVEARAWHERLPFSPLQAGAIALIALAAAVCARLVRRGESRADRTPA